MSSCSITMMTSLFNNDDVILCSCPHLWAAFPVLISMHSNKLHPETTLHLQLQLRRPCVGTSLARKPTKSSYSNVQLVPQWTLVGSANAELVFPVQIATTSTTICFHELDIKNSMQCAHPLTAHQGGALTVVGDTQIVRGHPNRFVCSPTLFGVSWHCSGTDKEGGDPIDSHGPWLLVTKCSALCMVFVTVHVYCSF